MIALRFTREDAERAFDEWHCNCGPSALAAMLGMTLHESRQYIDRGFDQKHYLSPSMMERSLHTLGNARRLQSWRRVGTAWPTWGLARIQWEGPWTEAGVPHVARYRHTHWVGAALGRTITDIGIWDVNAMGNGTGWCSRSDWASVIVPHILQDTPKAYGSWHVTHAIELKVAGHD